MSKEIDTAQRILNDMITSFIPAKEEELDDPDTLLLTTEELMQRMEPIMHVDKDALSRTLHEAGFRFIYEGETWKWMLKYV